MQQISNRNSDVPFGSISCSLTAHDFSFVKGLIFQSEPYRMTRLIQTMHLLVRCELTTFKTFCAELEILFGSHKPWILSVVRGPMKLTQLGDFGWCCFAPLTNCQVDSWAVIFSNVYCTSPSMLTLQVRTGMNTLVSTHQDKKSPGTHLSLNVWLSSALRVPICSFLASKRNDNALRTMANWSGCPTLNVSDLKCNSLPFVWWNHPKPHLMPQQAFKHLQRRPALIWRGK